MQPIKISDIASELIKSKLGDAREALIKKVIAKLTKKYAFLGLKFFNPILGFIVEKIVDVAYETLMLEIDFKIIDMKVNAQVSEWVKAVNALEAVTNEGGSNAENLDRARQALRDLIRLN